jgi:hypothetical protein
MGGVGGISDMQGKPQGNILFGKLPLYYPASHPKTYNPQHFVCNLINDAARNT